MTPYWRVKGGRRVPIPNLTTKHLENILVFLAKKPEMRLRAMAFIMHASDEYAPVRDEDAEVKKFEEMPLVKIYEMVVPHFQALLDEARKRGIEIPQKLTGA